MPNFQIFAGDCKQITLDLPIDPTGFNGVLKIKRFLSDPDSSSVIQKATGAGIVWEQEEETLNWEAIVDFVPIDTSSFLSPTSLVWALRLTDPNTGVTRIELTGTMYVEISAAGTPAIDIPIYTTYPTSMQNPPGGTVGQSLVKKSAADYDFGWGNPTATADWNTLLNKPTTLSGFGITDAYTKTYSDATYAALAHVHTFASLTAKPTTLAGYGITDAAALSHSHAFSSLTSIPTTVAGYGITDVYTKTQSDTNYAAAGHTHTFASLTSKPTTIAGYGITDALVLGSTGTTAAAGNHTHTFASLTSKPTTISGFGITDAMTTAHAANAITGLGASGVATTVSRSDHVHTFASLTSIPTTLAGYGITDAASSSHVHAAFTTTINGFVPNPGTSTGKYLRDDGTWQTISAGAADWTTLLNKPTTISGFGITDAYTKTQSDTNYAAASHTHTFASLTSKPTTLAGYGITDSLTLGSTGTTAAAGNHTHTFASLTSIPTTLAGYGITDAMANTHPAAVITGFGASGSATTVARSDHSHTNFTTSAAGMVPAPGTANGYFLRDDGTWAAAAGGSAPFMGSAPVLKSANYTVLTSDGGAHFYHTVASLVYTLPDATAFAGKKFSITAAGNNATLSRAGTDTISRPQGSVNQTSITLYNGVTYTIFPIGTVWYVAATAGIGSSLELPNMNAKTILGNSGASSGAPAGVTMATLSTMLGVNSSKATSYTVLTTDSGSTLYPTAASVVFTLPACSSNSGLSVTIHGSTYGCTVARNGTDTFVDNSGASVTSLTVAAGEAITLLSNGTTAWLIISDTFSPGGSYTTAVLNAMSAADSRRLGMAYCSDCLTADGTGAPVIYDSSISKWRVGTGVSNGVTLTTDKSTLMCELYRLGLGAGLYETTNYLFTDLIRDTAPSDTGMGHQGYGQFSNGGVQRYDSYGGGPALRENSSYFGQYLYTNANCYSKWMSPMQVKQASMYAGAIINTYDVPIIGATYPLWMFVGFSSGASANSSAETSMIGYLYDPQNILGFGATTAGYWHMLVRINGTVAQNSVSTIPNSPAGVRYMGLAITSNTSVEFWNNTNPAINTKTTYSGLSDMSGLYLRLCSFMARNGTAGVTSEYMHGAFIRGMFAR